MTPYCQCKKETCSWCETVKHHGMAYYNFSHLSEISHAPHYPEIDISVFEETQNSENNPLANIIEKLTLSQIDKIGI